jgi:hypothetical protein
MPCEKPFLFPMIANAAGHAGCKYNAAAGGSTHKADGTPASMADHHDHSLLIA